MSEIKPKYVFKGSVLHSSGKEWIQGSLFTQGNGDCFISSVNSKFEDFAETEDFRYCKVIIEDFIDDWTQVDPETVELLKEV